LEIQQFRARVSLVVGRRRLGFQVSTEASGSC
jgi:hypothetical protein